MSGQIKTEPEISAMRHGGQILARIIDDLKHEIKVGITSKDIANIANIMLKKNNVKPAFLHYQGFPDVICISINNEVVHGIPSKSRIIADGDIVGLDFGVIYKDMITDGAYTLIAGTAKNEKHIALLKDTEISLYKAIDKVRDGVRVGDIGSTIEKYLKKKNYGIVKDLVGHGVGRTLHEDPNIPNYGIAHTGTKLKKNMTIAIEPMVTLGSDSVRLSRDGWTIVTEDDSVSAHFEHTVLITKNGAEILTRLSV